MWANLYEIDVPLLTLYGNSKKVRKKLQLTKGCIVEWYIVEETIEFCIEYIGNVDSIGLPRSPHIERTTWEEIRRDELLTVSRKEWEQSHLYVLYNDDAVEPYVERIINYFEVQLEIGMRIG